LLDCNSFLTGCFQFKYHTKIDDLIERTLTGMKLGLIAKLVSVLESVLAKLTRYDEGSVIGSILSFTVSMYTGGTQCDQKETKLVQIFALFVKLFFLIFKILHIMVKNCCPFAVNSVTSYYKIFLLHKAKFCPI
jgi:hypothetical protein